MTCPEERDLADVMDNGSLASHGPFAVMRKALEPLEPNLKPRREP